MEKGKLTIPELTEFIVPTVKTKLVPGRRKGGGKTGVKRAKRDGGKLKSGWSK